MIKYILFDILIYILNLNLSIILMNTLSYYNNFKVCYFKKESLQENFLKNFLGFFLKCLVWVYVGYRYNQLPLYNLQLG